MIINEVKRLREDRITPLFGESEDLALAGRVSKETIDFFTHQIRRIEGGVAKRVALKEGYRYLLTLPGVGKILALTIMLEKGPIGRFETVGDYTSYCRKVPSQWISNGKRKGSGNRKNGEFHEALGVNWTGSKRVYKVAAAPTSYRRAHSRSRIFSSKKTLLLACGLLFSLDR